MYCGLNKNDKSYNGKEYIEIEPVVINEDRSKVGFIMGFLLGFIGFLIGVIIYPTNQEEGASFIRGWAKGLLLFIVIGIIVGFSVKCYACYK